MTSDFPPVSCICLTYGRPHVLEEAIYSFLLQDYAGPKELIVLNDYAEQTYRFDHLEVRVINLPVRFRTVGEKMNAAAALCSYDVLFVWDDDDLYLPHRLSYSMARFDPARGFFTTGRAWLWDQGEIVSISENCFHSGSCWSRELFDLVGGYPVMGNGYDQVIEQRFEEARPGSTVRAPMPDEDAFYIYRWGGIGSYHMSGFGQDAPNQNVEQASVASYVEAQMARGEVARGNIQLQPRWAQDYIGHISRFLDTRARVVR